MRTLLVVGALVIVAPTANADVLEWRDRDGVRHFTNVAAEIPEEYRDAAKNIISEEQWRSKSPEPPPQPEVAAPARKRAAARRAATEDNYRDGFEAGLDYAREVSPEVTVVAPPAPAPQIIIAAPQEAQATSYPAYGAYGWNDGRRRFSRFDGGQSRHITRRMVEQNLDWHDDSPPIFYGYPYSYPAQVVVPRHRNRERMRRR